MPGGVSQVRHVHRRAGGPRQGRGHRGRAHRARHQGRRPRRPSRARARGRRRPGLRRRPAFRAAGAGRRARTGSAPRARPRGSRWTPAGLREIDPTDLLVSGERVPGAATALPRSGRRALAVEVQALVGVRRRPGSPPGDRARRAPVPAGGGRARACGRPRRSVAAELFGASSGGVKMDDPACDLAVAAALASAATGALPPPWAPRSSARWRSRASCGPRPGHGAAPGRGPRGRLHHACSRPPRRQTSRFQGCELVPVRTFATRSHGRSHLLERVVEPREARRSALVRMGQSRATNSPLTCGFGLRRKARSVLAS